MKGGGRIKCRQWRHIDFWWLPLLALTVATASWSLDGNLLDQWMLEVTQNIKVTTRRIKKDLNVSSRRVHQMVFDKMARNLLTFIQKTILNRVYGRVRLRRNCLINFWGPVILVLINRKTSVRYYLFLLQNWLIEKNRYVSYNHSMHGWLTIRNAWKNSTYPYSTIYPYALVYQTKSTSLINRKTLAQWVENT